MNLMGEASRLETQERVAIQVQRLLVGKPARADGTVEV